MRLRTIYICHPYRDDPERNLERMRKFCRYAASQGHVPICTPLFFPQWGCEEQDAIPMCVELVYRCDELWICSNRITEGMSPEINAAYSAGMPVRHYPLSDTPDEKI